MTKRTRDCSDGVVVLERVVEQLCRDPERTRLQDVMPLCSVCKRARDAVHAQRRWWLVRVSHALALDTGPVYAPPSASSQGNGVYFLCETMGKYSEREYSARLYTPVRVRRALDFGHPSPALQWHVTREQWHALWVVSGFMHAGALQESHGDTLRDALLGIAHTTAAQLLKDTTYSVTAAIRQADELRKRYDYVRVECNWTSRSK